MFTKFKNFKGTKKYTVNSLHSIPESYTLCKFLILLLITIVLRSLKKQRGRLLKWA